MTTVLPARRSIQRVRRIAPRSAAFVVDSSSSRGWRGNTISTPMVEQARAEYARLPRSVGIVGATTCLRPRFNKHDRARYGVGGPIRSGNLVGVGGIGGWYPEKRPDGPGDVRQQFGDALESMKASTREGGHVDGPCPPGHRAAGRSREELGRSGRGLQSELPRAAAGSRRFGAAGFRRGGQLLQVDCICYVD